jgi:hypothetical protein
MWPLISDMVQDDPAKRPTIDHVVKRFADMCKKLGILKLRTRVGPRDESDSEWLVICFTSSQLSNTL